jgi:hypothetical protein
MNPLADGKHHTHIMIEEGEDDVDDHPIIFNTHFLITKI